jgi:hypothetical protein
MPGKKAARESIVDGEEGRRVRNWTGRYCLSARGGGTSFSRNGLVQDVKGAGAIG